MLLFLDLRLGKEGEEIAMNIFNLLDLEARLYPRRKGQVPCCTAKKRKSEEKKRKEGREDRYHPR